MNILEMAMAAKMAGGNGGTGPIDPKRLPEGYPYKDEKLTLFLPETELTFYTPEGAPENINMADGVTVSDFGIEKAKPYNLRIVWDGVSYDRMPVQYANYQYAIGNMALAGGGDDTGEPFLIMMGRVTGGDATYEVDFSFMGASAGKHTVSIAEVSETIHPMALEFLPEGYAYKKNESEQVLVDKLTVSAGTMLEGVQIEVGKNYVVYIDGERYEATGEFNGEANRLVVGEYQVRTAIYEGNTTTFEGSGEHELTLVEVVSDVVQFDNEFIPKLVVTITKSGDTYTSSHIGKEIRAAVSAGIPVYAVLSNAVYDAYTHVFTLSGVPDANEIAAVFSCMYRYDGNLRVDLLQVNKTDTGARMFSYIVTTTEVTA